ncbi:MAG TPA: ankyrin repeat domain-containing protein [Chthonomonadaceae bacterium]|nr:ankyrin repeat domain-containing protein [Chthonomonadaceae bacterium]
MDPGRENVPWMLTQTAAMGSLEIVEAILAQGADVDLTEDSGCTALTYAAHGGHLEVMEALLRAGADPNHRDNDSESVLMSAADHPGNASALRILIAAGADVNATSPTGETPLYWIAWSGKDADPEMLEVLLDAGADPITPGILTLAAYHGFTAGVSVLMARGADPSRPDHKGETALAIAKRRGHREIVALLKQAASSGKDIG